MDTTVTKRTVADSSIISFAVPKVGIRVGGGEWNNLMLDAGVDVTFHVPIIPLPAIRVDGEVWGDTSTFGSNRHGNALSLMGIQSFIAGYAGAGLTYYYTDNQGDHESGIGLKGLVGMNLPHSTYVEAGIILGPSSLPIFFTIGQRF